MMKIKPHIIFGALILLITLFSACSGLRKIGDGQFLYTGSQIKYEAVKKIANRAAIDAELLGLIDVKKNTKLMWMRPFLSLHNFLPEPKNDKGFFFWLKYRVGEPPALLQNFDLKTVNVAMENRLQNRGYFDVGVSSIVKKRRKTAAVIFTAIPGRPYILKSVNYPDGNEVVVREIHNLRSGSILHPGAQYLLSDFENERNRIDDLLKNKGYYYFSPDYLLFTADTAAGNRQIDVELNVKPNISTEAAIPYHINNVYVFDDFSLGDYHPDTTLISNYYYISSGHLFKPQTILNAIFVEKDSLYSRIDHFNTLGFLMGLGVYKFANARFTLADSTRGQMDVKILLTPVKKISISSEVSAAIKTNNFAGPGLNLILKNKNAFRGAELLMVNLGGRFEVQMGGQTKGQTNFEVTLDGSLTLPRIVPVRFSKKTTKRFVPKTIFTIGGGLFSRVNLYQLYSFNTSLGYDWKSSERITHLFRPIDISFTKLAKSSARFEDYLLLNPNVRKSFEEQFIIGSSYTFTLSNIYLRNRKHNFYLNESIDIAGNLASLLLSATTGKYPTPETPLKLLNVPYSQFIRLRNEFRYFYNPGKNSLIGFRVIAAAGLPYRNSSAMPYIKQFYVGGTNSIRAFPARSIGPGTYLPPDSLNIIYIDQTGDIKLESTLEYRFPIYKYFKGALFIDAGNIWLVNEDTQRPGGKFDPGKFYSEIAVGSGLGLRFDFSYVVLRLDMAFPLRKPYLPEGNRWVISSISPGNPSWRKENIILNLAIGYPF